MTPFKAGDTVRHIHDGAEGLVLSWGDDKDWGMVQFGANSEAEPMHESVLRHADRAIAGMPGWKKFGWLISFVNQSSGAPVRDRCFTRDSEGVRYDGHCWLLSLAKNEYGEHEPGLALVIARLPKVSAPLWIALVYIAGDLVRTYWKYR